MDESECWIMRERGTSATWRAMDLACRLHKWQAPLHSGSSDGRLTEGDSRRKAGIIRGMGGRATERGT